MSKTLYENIPMLVRDLRGSRTLAELADGCGVSASFISDIERGRTVPSLKTLHRICEACNVALVIDTTPLANANAIRSEFVTVSRKKLRRALRAVQSLDMSIREPADE